jgi:hypothetical protein
MKVIVSKDRITLKTENAFEVLGLTNFQNKKIVAWVETWASSDDGFTNGVIQIQFEEAKGVE